MIDGIRNFLVALLLALLAAVVAGIGWKALAVLDRVEAAALVAEDTLRIGRSALAEQRTYYRALSKMAVHDANRLGKTIAALEQAIRNEDARLAAAHRDAELVLNELRLSAEASGVTLTDIGMTARTLAEQTGRIGDDSGRLLVQGPRFWLRWRIGSRAQPGRKRRPTWRNPRPTWSVCRPQARKARTGARDPEPEAKGFLDSTSSFTPKKGNDHAR